ncbi:MAG: chloroperoxidase [Verrucomicrobiota bacterium]|nr:chloroperoxidase [Verrucomicrobiota bacterium]
MKTFSIWILSLAASAFAGGSPNDHRDVLGPHLEPAPQVSEAKKTKPPRRDDPTGRILSWNEIALDANALDHTPVGATEIRVFGEQVGPGRTSRALAIVHIAIFDAVNAIYGGYQSYTGLAPARRGTSADAAIAQAAHDTLVALYPSHAAGFDKLLAEDLDQPPHGRAKRDGINLGRRAAAAILALRLNDGSYHTEPFVGVDYFPSDQPGKWRIDPISQIPVALGAFWGGCTPFVLQSSRQFPAPAPPALDSAEYAEAFDEVQRLGGDGVITPTERTEDQTIAGIYWGYDGTPNLGTPPRLYNQIAVHIATQLRSETVELARLLALVNVALADAGFAIWETKYKDEFWRPITAIREAEEGTGPTGLGDGNPATAGDPNYTPLGAPASNLVGPNFTPPFPAYPSGHAGFGAALFQTLRNFTAPIGSPSPSRPTSSTASRSTTQAACGRSLRAASPRSPRPRKRMRRAASISAFIGLSMPAPASSKAGRWRITCSRTPSCRSNKYPPREPQTSINNRKDEDEINQAYRVEFFRLDARHERPPRSFREESIALRGFCGQGDAHGSIPP